MPAALHNYRKNVNLLGEKKTPNYFSDRASSGEKKRERERREKVMAALNALSEVQAKRVWGFSPKKLGGEMLQTDAELPQHWQDLISTTADSWHPGWEGSQGPEEPTPWDDPKGFLASFEQVAEACRWPRKEWAARLLPALRREAEQAFGNLEARDRQDYGKVKAAILHRDALSREKRRQHFRRFRYQEAEGPRGVYNRLQALCRQWLKSWVRERGPACCAQAVALAEDFLWMQRESLRWEQQVRPPSPFSASSASSSTLLAEYRPHGGPFGLAKCCRRPSRPKTFWPAGCCRRHLSPSGVLLEAGEDCGKKEGEKHILSLCQTPTMTTPTPSHPHPSPPKSNITLRWPSMNLSLTPLS
ncbi:SCAN domain-containing protein 3, partial [Ophiophagus hannah]